MSTTETALQQALTTVKQRIAHYAQKYARAPESVQLIAVSKRQSSARVRTAWQLGQRCFGENYLQEALSKQIELQDCDIAWHFIGPIQSNKTRELAQHFALVHSVDRVKIAQRLHEQRPSELPPLRILLQVNLSEEASKSGTTLAELSTLAAQVAELSRVRLCGLMAIPAPSDDFNSQRLVFRQLAEARELLQQQGHVDCVELSMGMSADFEAAIAEGATLVRIGTDIFGRRS